MHPDNTSPSAVALASWTPAPAATIDAPDHIFAGYDVPDYLAVLYAPDAFLNGSVRRTVAAYGTAARLWAPLGTRTSAADALAALYADDDPMARFRQWASALPAEIVAELSEAAFYAADRLVEDIRATTPDFAVSWLCDRDDMTIVATVLAWHGRDDLARYLASIDADARARFDGGLTLAAAHEIADDARLRAVAWQEPDSLVGVIVGEALTSGVR